MRFIGGGTIQERILEIHDTLVHGVIYGNLCLTMTNRQSIPEGGETMKPLVSWSIMLFLDVAMQVLYQGAESVKHVNHTRPVGNLMTHLISQPSIPNKWELHKILWVG